MLVKTILNKCYLVKNFVYGKVKLKDYTLTVQIYNRDGSQGQCSQCQPKTATYDHLKERRFRFTPLWGYRVEFIYKPRRLECSEHGIRVEYLPWADGKSPICPPFKILLAHWVKYLSWQEVARQFKVTWKNVFESVEYIVEYGLKHRLLNNIQAIGIDEIQYLIEHQYLNLVYQIDSSCRRLLFIGKDISAKTLLRFFIASGNIPNRFKRSVAIFGSPIAGCKSFATLSCKLKDFLL